MGATIASTPAADGYRMPAECEAHSGCWMAWPERADNWRLAGGPAQDAYAAVAEAITVRSGDDGRLDAQFERCRAMLSPSIRVVELSSDDAWMRDTGPTFVVDARGERARRRLALQRVGRSSGGLYCNWDRDERVARKVLEYEGPLAIARRSCSRAARSTSTARAPC